MLQPPRIRPAVASASMELRGVSVIIPAYADTPRLRRAIWSVHASADLPYELIVSLAERSVAANRNAGLARATQDLVAFLDDDVLLPAGWISRLARVIDADPSIGAASAYLTFPNGAPQMRRQDLAAGEVWRVTIPGTCFLYSRARVGDLPFDESYPGSQWEDTDWMWSLRERGLATVVVGDVHALHDHELVNATRVARSIEVFRAKWGRLPEPEETATISAEELARWRPLSLAE